MATLRTPANTQLMATDSTLPFTPSKKARHAASSKSAKRLPSNSKPPPIMAVSTATAAISSDQSTMGGMPTEAGAPMRRMAIGANPLRSTMAFVHCVVPSIACLMSLRSMFAWASTASTAPMMPCAAPARPAAPLPRWGSSPRRQPSGSRRSKRRRCWCRRHQCQVCTYLLNFLQVAFNVAARPPLAPRLFAKRGAPTARFARYASLLAFPILEKED